jgi:hypothetical protein
MNMRGKLWKVAFVFFSTIILSVSAAQACGTCPPEPCTGCPPVDETVPLDGGLTLVLLGAAALGVKKVTGLKENKF